MNSPATINEVLPRVATVHRKTAETEISASVLLDGHGRASIATGIAFLDHMFGALAKHARFDVTLTCKGDLEIDDHHSAEDCAMVLGQAIDQALGERRGIARFGSAYAPLDEAMARAVVDLSGRPWPEIHLNLVRENLGALACENLIHVLRTLAIATRANFHVDVLRGDNDHHKAEAAFKALALALREAVKRDNYGDVPSTKGTLG
jgi:imidazoleglycerol phosphate dehydratase HisB